MTVEEAEDDGEGGVLFSERRLREARASLRGQD
jgi:hypothetical protein